MQQHFTGRVAAIPSFPGCVWSGNGSRVAVAICRNWSRMQNDHVNISSDCITCVLLRVALVSHLLITLSHQCCSKSCEAAGCWLQVCGRSCRGPIHLQLTSWTSARWQAAAIRQPLSCDAACRRCAIAVPMLAPNGSVRSSAVLPNAFFWLELLRAVWICSRVVDCQFGSICCHLADFVTLGARKVYNIADPDHRRTGLCTPLIASVARVGLCSL